MAHKTQHKKPTKKLSKKIEPYYKPGAYKRSRTVISSSFTCGRRCVTHVKNWMVVMKEERRTGLRRNISVVIWDTYIL